jgi:hypothetical protein
MLNHLRLVLLLCTLSTTAVAQYELSVVQELPGHIVGTAGYSGNKGPISRPSPAPTWPIL